MNLIPKIGWMAIGTHRSQTRCSWDPFPANNQTISTSPAQFYFQRFDDLSVRDSEVTPEDEAGTVYLDLRHEPRDLELEARRWRQVSRCQNIFRWVPNIFSTVAAMSRPPAGPLRGLGPPLRRMRRGLHTRPLLMSGYSEYIFKACRVSGELFVSSLSQPSVCSITRIRIS